MGYLEKLVFISGVNSLSNLLSIVSPCHIPFNGQTLFCKPKDNNAYFSMTIK